MKWKLSVGSLEFYATLVKCKQGLKLLRIGVLKSGSACVEIQIFPQESFNLLGVDFNSKCSSNRDMFHGGDTRTMIRASLVLLKTLYPNCKELTLQDNSFIECNETPGNVSLANYLTLVNGKTWYQKHFNAEYYESDLDKSRLIEGIKKIDGKYKNMSCSEFLRDGKSIREQYGIPNLNGSEWVIQKFPEIDIKIEEDNRVRIKGGGFIKYL